MQGVSLCTTICDHGQDPFLILATDFGQKFILTIDLIVYFRYIFMHYLALTCLENSLTIVIQVKSVLFVDPLL